MNTEMKVCPRGRADLKFTSNKVLQSNFETHKMSTIEHFDRPQKHMFQIQNYKYMDFVDLLEHNIGPYRIQM